MLLHCSSSTLNFLFPTDDAFNQGGSWSSLFAVSGTVGHAHIRNHLLIFTLWQSSARNPGLCNGGWTDKNEGGEEILVGWSYQEVIGVRTLDKEIAWGKLLAWHGRYSCMKQPYPGRTLFICVYPLPTPNMAGTLWACGCSIKNCGSCWVLWIREVLGVEICRQCSLKRIIIYWLDHWSFVSIVLSIWCLLCYTWCKVPLPGLGVGAALPLGTWNCILFPCQRRWAEKCVRG
jgi:hypothetical protein